MSSCPPHSAEISAPEISSMPRLSPSARASGRPWRVSWSVRAKASRPASAIFPTSAAGESSPSETVEWLWRSIFIEARSYPGREARIESPVRGALAARPLQGAAHDLEARRHGPRFHPALDRGGQADPLRLPRQEERDPALLSARLLARLLGRDQAMRRDAPDQGRGRRRGRRHLRRLPLVAQGLRRRSRASPIPLLADFHPKGAVAEKYGVYLPTRASRRARPSSSARTARSRRSSAATSRSPATSPALLEKARAA